MADLLSRWTCSPNDFSKLLSQVQDPVWVPVNQSLLDIDPELYMLLLLRSYPQQGPNVCMCIC